MAGFYSKSLKIFWWLVAVTVIFLGALAIWVYSGQPSLAKVGLMDKLNLPVASVNSSFVSIRELEFRYQLAQKVLNSEQQTNSTQVKNLIVDQIIKERVVAELAKKHSLSVSSAELDQIFTEESSQNSNGKDFISLLSDYGLTENSYKTVILKPKILTQKLQVWFNSQSSLNQKPYALAQNLLGQIQAGADMAKLAEQYSQDQFSKSTKGDMGFVDVTNLSPELREPVSNLKLGETKIIPGQEGINIIRLENKTANKLQLREIFITTEDFNAWLKQQINNTKIFKLINF